MDGIPSGLVNSSLQIKLFESDVVEFSGQKFTPDDTKGYFKFTLSHCFPVATLYGTALHPNVVAMSYQSLLHQNVNYEHQLQAYYKEPGKDSNVRDRVIGSIVAVEYPEAPSGGWMIGTDPEKTPGISGVAVFYKLTEGMNRILGEHQGGRHQWAVSMEVQYAFDESGFAVKLKKDPELDHTPEEMLAAGWEYIPWKEAPDELVATFSKKRHRIVAQWKGRECFLLMGGIRNLVHYAGVGVVRYGAEPTAKITRLAASAAPVMVEPFQNLADLLEQALAPKRAC